MALTRSELGALNEAELRLRVLIPLFKAMNFRDVHHYHGGSQEHGKDIVIWESDRLRERVNYAVVAKATTISGQASGNSSAAEVRFQTEQCFNIPYADPVTTEGQRVHRCLVVTSKEIRKEALNAVKDILKQQHLDIATEFIDGNKLWELIEQYMPSWTVLEKVQQAQAVFEEVSPNYRITVATKGGIPVYSFEEKHPGAAEVEPLEISVRCQFPQTVEGRQRLQAIEQHIKTGAPVTLEGSYIKEFTLPPFLRSVFDPEQLARGVLSINPQRSPRPIVVTVAVENDCGCVAFDYIELYVTQAGMEEATFDNIEQPVP
jgi:primosomal replication protein N